MVRGTFYIVFIRVVIIQFYPKIRHHVKDWGYEDWRTMVLRRPLNTIQSKKKNQFPKHCKMEERSKKDKNYKIRVAA